MRFVSSALTAVLAAALLGSGTLVLAAPTQAAVAGSVPAAASTLVPPAPAPPSSPPAPFDVVPATGAPAAGGQPPVSGADQGGAAPLPAQRFIAPGIPSASASAAGFARSARVKVTLVTVRTADKTAAQTAAINLRAAKNSVISANAYWRTMSNNRLSISIVRVITGFKTKARSTQSFETILETVTRELKFKLVADTSLIVFMPRGDVIVHGKGGNIGAGWSAGSTSGRILMPYPGPYANPVVAHEFGHVFGLAHANALQCNNGRPDAGRLSGTFFDASCYSREYADTTDLMGATQSAQPSINAVSFDYGSFGRGNEIVNAGIAAGTKTYTLRPWAGTAARRAVKFADPISGDIYYLQLRLPVGYDKSTAVNGNSGVEVLKPGLAAATSLLIPPTTVPFAGWYDKHLAWQAGSTFTTFSGTTVSINWITGSAASVTVRAATLNSVFSALAGKYQLGPATGAIVTGLRGGGAFQNFQRGSAIHSPVAGNHASFGVTRTKWALTGYETGRLGYPTSEVIPIRNGGVYQNYQRGVIYSSPTTGAHISVGGVRAAWTAVGRENGPLGYPTSDEVATGGAGVTQTYEGGIIVWTAKLGAHGVAGAMAAKFTAVGGLKALGYATGDRIPLRNGGAHQVFQKGALVSTPAKSVFFSVGKTRAAWASAGSELGRLGYPTSDNYTTANRIIAQDFDGGRVVIGRDGKASIIYGTSLPPIDAAASGTSTRG